MKPALLALALWVAIPGPARAHDHWINRNELRDPYTNVWCCNDKDCDPQPAGAVRRLPGGDGYLIVATGEVWPEDRVIWRSGDGRWWRCVMDDKNTRCLIGPPPSN